jgi:hypothetical protein
MMSEGKWTPEGLERMEERFRVATVALKDVNDWLDRKGENPPQCIIERAAFHAMYPEEYYTYYKSLDMMDTREIHAIEDWAIHQVQPEWKRNPNP